ncbi:MAG: DUF374 domain-containing protein [Chitinivibrionales bacterium]|nr:DUF374 domain-containing protein [Chitinivibrionales bacterium]
MRWHRTVKNDFFSKPYVLRCNKPYFIAMHASFSSEFFGFCSWTIFTLLGKSWRYSFHGNRRKNPHYNSMRKTIYCFWHSQLLMFAYGFRHCNMTTVVSASSDGDKATAIAKRWGQNTIRGSSSKGGLTALRQCLRLLKNNRNLVLIPDGPKGPREIVKPGIAHIALTSRSPVVPLTARAHRAWRLNSWDRFVIPKPFSTIDITFHDPVPVADNDTVESSNDRITYLIQQALSNGHKS